jgi:membrane associated rhomboid family serine protease
MIPLRDNVPSDRTPFVNYLVIALCTLAFLAQLATRRGPEHLGLVEEYGMVPFRITHPGEPFEIPVDVRVIQGPEGLQQVIVVEPGSPAAVPAILTMLTCIFLHGGWMHFLGNMWFLWIFGDNIEDRLGHIGFLIFYVACGVAASVAHLMSDPGSTLPTIGASGAIAGVMGAYFVWYPHSRVHTLVPIFYFLHFVDLPAPLFLGVWFLMQFLQGATTQGLGGGVAWWAHIGGFVVGAGAALLLDKSGLLPPRKTTRIVWDDEHRW